MLEIDRKISNTTNATKLTSSKVTSKKSQKVTTRNETI